MEFKSTASRAALQQHLEYLHRTSQGGTGGKGAAMNVASSSSRLVENNNNNHQVAETKHFYLERPLDLNGRFLAALDRLDTNVEKLRKDAMFLQEKRDYLLMSIDLIKNNDLLASMCETEREEILTYIERVSARLNTVQLTVRTVRDQAQQDALSQVNSLIDMMITIGDPVYSRQRCQQYLNACCSSAEKHHAREYGTDTDLGPIDKHFESVLLGCTLDDQKSIKKRLQALMTYLNKQTISHSVEVSSSRIAFNHMNHRGGSTSAYD